MNAISVRLRHAAAVASFGGAWRAIVFCVLLAAGFARAEVPVPPLRARVTDLTGTLNTGQQASLEQALEAFEAKKGSQIAVLLVPTTQPEAIEQYSIRVVDAWQLGRKGVDDGALLIVAKDDHKLRIEVGRGLEGALPDVIAKRIIREIITPRFKEGDFYGGISAGVASIIKVIEGEPLPPPESARRTGARPDIESWLMFAFIVIVVGGAVLRGIFGRFLGASIVGAVTGLIAWALIGPFLVAIIVGMVAFVFNLFGGARGWSGLPGGWMGGGWSSGGWSGGSGGGGGGFGGGGASGNW